MNSRKKGEKTKLTMHAEDLCNFSGKMHLGSMLKKRGDAKLWKDASLSHPSPNVATNFQRRTFLFPLISYF